MAMIMTVVLTMVMMMAVEICNYIVAIRARASTSVCDDVHEVGQMRVPELPKPPNCEDAQFTGDDEEDTGEGGEIANTLRRPTMDLTPDHDRDVHGEPNFSQRLEKDSHRQERECSGVGEELEKG